MATTPSGSDPAKPAVGLDDSISPAHQRTHHDVGHAQTIGTGPVGLPTGTGTGSNDYTMPRADGSTDVPAGELVGEYRVERKIGEGGMGVVYGAVHPLIGKRAAIKVLNKNLCMQPEAVERFVTEARAVNQIGHPNIVDIFSFGNLHDGRSYFAMEWLEGRSLADRLRKGRPTLAETCAVMDDVAEALESAHAKRIVHRDLKPDNIFLVAAPGGRTKVKLLDFGIAKLLDDSSDRVTRTRTGSLMGTPLYVAPEQARGYEIDARVDVYSLGAVAFEMITGRPPFVADNAMDVVAMHLHSEPPRASTFGPVAPQLDAMLAGMLAKEPDARPTLAQFRAVLAEVKALPDGGIVVAAPVVAPAPAVAQSSLDLAAPRSRAGVWIGIVLGVALLGGGGVVYMATRGDDTPKPEPQAKVEPEPAPVKAPPVPENKEPEPAIGSGTGTGTGAAAAAVGTVVLKISADGAVVKAGDAEVPVEDGVVKLELAPGKHKLEVEAPGYHDKVVDVNVVAGKELALTPKLERDRKSSKSSKSDKTSKTDKTVKTGTDKGTAAGTSAGTAAGTAATKKDPVDDGEGVSNPFKKKKP